MPKPDPDGCLALARGKVNELALLLAEAQRGAIGGGSRDYIEQVALALLEVEPMHAGARLALGHVYYDDRWMTPGERDLLRRRRLASQERQGDEADEGDEAGELLSREAMRVAFHEQLGAAGRDVDALWRAHLYAVERDMPSLARLAAERVLAVRPGHELANLALDHVQYQGRWYTRQELAYLEARRSGRTAEIRTPPPVWVEVVGEEALTASAGRADIWLQVPSSGVDSELRGRFAELVTRIGEFTDGFVARQRRALARLGLTRRQLERKRISVAVFTEVGAYRDFAETEGETLAAQQVGFVPLPGALAILRTPSSLSADHAPFYDQLMLEAFRPRLSPEEHRRVLWRNAIDAQARFGEDARVHVEATEKFVVLTRDTRNNQRIAAQAIAQVGELEQRMRDDELLIERSGAAEPAQPAGPVGPITLLLCDDPQELTDVARRTRARQLPSWGGVYEPDQLMWLCGRRYRDDVLHGAALALLHQVTRRLPADDDAFWFHEGLAHVAAGAVLGNRDEVHPRWGAQARRALGTPRLLPLALLMKSNRRTVLASTDYATRPERYHAQSWALMHFLWHTQGGLYRPRLRSLLGACQRMRIDYATIEKMLPIDDLPALERAFHRHVKGLR